MMSGMLQDPFGVFTEEHQHALGELDRLEQAVQELSAGRDVERNLAHIRHAHAFLSSAVRTHNEHEEQALFPFLDEDAPTQLFIDEHVQLRNLEEKLQAALAGEEPRDPVIDLALEIVHLLRAHIHREDEALFPMARAMLGPEGTVRVARELDRLMDAAG